LILAEIKKENEASKKAFENAGFQEQRAGDALYEFFLSRK
jgi:RimJ/RimL family protein N-acetyltransferase